MPLPIRHTLETVKTMDIPQPLPYKIATPTFEEIPQTELVPEPGFRYKTHFEQTMKSLKISFRTKQDTIEKILSDNTNVLRTIVDSDPDIFSRCKWHRTLFNTAKTLFEKLFPSTSDVEMEDVDNKHELPPDGVCVVATSMEISDDDNEENQQRRLIVDTDTETESESSDDDFFNPRPQKRSHYNI